MNDFVRSWKVAGDEMERQRNERLQKMDPAYGARMMGATEIPSREYLYANGLARWQCWMMRWRLQDLMAQVATSVSGKESPERDA